MEVEGEVEVLLSLQATQETDSLRFDVSHSAP